MFHFVYANFDIFSAGSVKANPADLVIKVKYQNQQIIFAVNIKKNSIVF